MNIATSNDRRRSYDRVVIADPRIVDRRQEWERKIEARKQLELRERYIAQSVNQQKECAA